MFMGYKETKVDVRPVVPKSLISIQIPSQENAPRRTKFSVSTTSSIYDSNVKDEEAFARRYLATQSSVYFRQRKVYPRSFLWRVVDDNRALEIQPSDLAKSVHEHHEAHLTLRFEFDDTILPSGVALADSEDHEAFNVFIITADKPLHTLTLRPEFFKKAALIDENIGDWCKICTPAPLAFAYPHRLHASSPWELFISLDNGALLRLTRRTSDDGSHWSPITFDERPWGASLKGFVKWSNKQTVRYNGSSLDLNTANAIATTSDQTHVFAVCLNHTLKAWNLATNKLVGTKDLLNRPGQQQEHSPVTLNPAESAYIRVFNSERAMDGGERFFVATYSPHDEGQFKFWAVRGGLTADLSIDDLFPEAKLKLPDPDPSGNMFWSVADFQIKPMDEGTRLELWVLWRNNNLYQVYSLHFDFATLEDAWRDNWIGTAMELRRDELPPITTKLDVVDPTEKWMKFMFYPGKYSPEVLETSLAIYQDALKPRGTLFAKKAHSLQERLCSSITATVSLRKQNNDEMDYTRYWMDIDAKWRQFWQIAEDLNKRRTEALTLTYDTYTELPIVLFTDACCLLRECSSTELLLHNDGNALDDKSLVLGDRWRHRNLDGEMGQRPVESARLVELAASFRGQLSSELQQCCRVALKSEIVTEPTMTASDRIAAFHERCEFGDRISDEVFDSVFSSIEDVIGMRNLATELFYSVIETAPLGFPGKDSDLLETSFGRRVTVQGSQETIKLNQQVLYDLLLFVVFLDNELTAEDGAPFDGGELFTTLIEMLKEYEMMSWLSSNVRSCPDKFEHALDMSISGVSEPGSQAGRCATILEDLFAIHIKPRPTGGVSQSFALTLHFRDVISWITRQGEVPFPNVAVFILCDLLANNNIDLASDFLPFLPTTAWATYAKGRLYVAKSEFDVASIHFQKASYLLSFGKAQGNLHSMSSNLLDIVAMDSFHNGLPKYFQHVVAVFEEARAFGHVADFARLALQALESYSNPAEQEHDYVSLRTDLLSRLFHASLKTCQFDQAYSALSRYTDAALQKSAMTSLITTILAAAGPGTAGLKQLLHFPLSLAPNLSSHVDDTLVTLAKKQTTFSSPLNRNAHGAWSVSGQSGPSTPDYHRILHAYRIARNDFRGAAEIGYQTVQRLRKIRDTPSFSRLMDTDDAQEPPQQVEEDDLESKDLRFELLSLINLLACVEKSEAYILVERDAPADHENDGAVFADEVSSPASASKRSSFGFEGQGRKNSLTQLHSPFNKPQKRVVITLEELRREYQAELDRVSRIERGDWEFGGDVAGGNDSTAGAMNLL